MIQLLKLWSDTRNLRSKFVAENKVILYSTVRNDLRIMNTRFNPYFLMQVGEILANRGFHETKVFLWDSCNDSCLRKQAEALIPIIRRMEDMEFIQMDRSNGRFLLKEIL